MGLQLCAEPTVIDLDIHPQVSLSEYVLLMKSDLVQ